MLRLFMVFVVATGGVRSGIAGTGTIRKTSDVVVYKDDRFYSAFPSIVKRPNGELLVAFRRAPERRLIGEDTSHTDANSYLVMVRSRDQGATWTSNPELIYAHALGGSQDPCMVQLRDNSILCASYGWMPLTPQAAGRLTNISLVGNFGFLGGYLVRSTDDGRTWQGPIYPPPRLGETFNDPFGKPLPAYNRGAMCEGKDGNLYWVVASASAGNRNRSETHLLTSSDKGRTWKYSCPVAADDKAGFNETSLYETPSGDLVAFLRTENFNDHTVIARSGNRGRSFEQWEDAGFQGHPHHAIRLPDKRVLLVYGYRHAPFGVRARILNLECTDARSAQELILREDGGNGDLGYPWATLISRHRALVVYYFNQKDGTRFIGGTFLELD